MNRYIAFDLGSRYENDAAITAMHHRHRDEAQEFERRRRGAVSENHDPGDEDRR